MEKLIKFVEKNVAKRDTDILEEKGGNAFYAYHIEKDSPLLLMAHVDIARGREGKLSKINKYLYKCIGADDRLGVAIIEFLLEKGYKFNWILTNGEECGGVGAGKMIKELKLKEMFKHVNLVIGLDRSGSSHYVSYSEPYDDYSDILIKAGLIDEGCGSYSDCKDIADCLGVWHINIAVGYYNEHTDKEYFNINETEYAVYVVENLLKRNDIPKTKVVKKSYLSYKFDRKYSHKYDDWHYDDWYYDEYPSLSKKASEEDGKITLSIANKLLKKYKYLFVETMDIYFNIDKKDSLFYLLDENWSIKSSFTPQELVDFLNSVGVTVEDLTYLT